MIARDIASEQKGWNSRETLEFYQNNRRLPDELYRSERFFLPDLLPRVKSVIDVGCAAGGFFDIMRSYNSTVRYVGVDIIPELIDRARQAHPDGEFHIGDGVHFSFPDGSFDLAHSSGVLHLNSRYQDMVAAMWRQTRAYLLCDFRLTTGPGFVGEMTSPALPYHVLNVDELLRFLKQLSPAPTAIRAKGYPHAAAAAARLPAKEIIMACFLLDKQPGTRPITEINLNVI